MPTPVARLLALDGELCSSIGYAIAIAILRMVRTIRVLYNRTRIVHTIRVRYKISYRTRMVRYTHMV